MSRMKAVSAIQPASRSRGRFRAAYRSALALFALLALSACSALLDDGRAPPTTWWLEPANLSSGAPLPALTLEVTVVPGLDSDRILTLDDDAQLNHFAGALWPEHLAEWMPSLVGRSLETAPSAPGEDACRLELELRRFWARLGAENKARSAEVAMTGTVQCSGGQPFPVAIDASEPVSDHRLPAIVSAFQRAFDDAQQQLTRQVAEHVGERSGS